MLQRSSLSLFLKRGCRLSSHGHGSKSRTPSEHPNPTTKIDQNGPPNGTVGFDPQPHGVCCRTHIRSLGMMKSARTVKSSAEKPETKSIPLGGSSCFDSDPLNGGCPFGFPSDACFRRPKMVFVPFAVLKPPKSQKGGSQNKKHTNSHGHC